MTRNASGATILAASLIAGFGVALVNFAQGKTVDAQTRADLQDVVLEVWRTHDATVLFVTHDIDEAVYLADRVVVLTRPPTSVAREVAIDLPRPRDQVETRASRAFATHRADVARLIVREPPLEVPTGAG